MHIWSYQLLHIKVKLYTCEMGVPAYLIGPKDKLMWYLHVEELEGWFSQLNLSVSVRVVKTSEILTYNSLRSELKSFRTRQLTTAWCNDMLSAESICQALRTKVAVKSHNTAYTIASGNTWDSLYMRFPVGFRSLHSETFQSCQCFMFPHTVTFSHTPHVGTRPTGQKASAA